MALQLVWLPPAEPLDERYGCVPLHHSPGGGEEEGEGGREEEGKEGEEEEGKEGGRRRRGRRGGGGGGGGRRGEEEEGGRERERRGGRSLGYFVLYVYSPLMCTME